MSIPSISTLIFIDPTVSDYQSLINGIRPDVNVIVLDPARDGVTQITQAIAQQGAVATIHIVSHGEPGRLYLGASELGLATLSRYAKQLRSWSEQLTDNAEILIYGCKVAYGAVGRCFIQQFGRLTGATIAASANLTGSAALGGDWELEVKTGEIQSALAFPASSLAAYPFVLGEAFPNLLYGVTGTDIRVINTANGSSTSAGSLSFSTFAISRESNTGRVYYIETIANNARVAYWEPATNTNVTVGTTGLSSTQFVKLSQAQDGTLYALTSGNTNLYRINPATGAATSLGAISGGTPAFGAASGDAAFDPQNAYRLFITTVVSGKLELYTVDTNPASPTFLNATHIGDTGLGNSSIGSLAFGQDGQLYAASQVSGTHSIYRINQATGASMLVGSTGGINFTDMGTLPTPTAEVDIQVTANTDGLTNVTPGSSITYNITVKNNSAIFDLRNISVSDVVPSDITGVTWTATITGGGSFPGAGDAAGSGNTIGAKVILNAGASVTYTITGTVSSSATPGSTLTNTATATVPNGIIDPNTANDSLSDTTTIVAPLDTTVPVVTVNTLTTADGTPALTGTIDDPTATIQVSVNGTNYTATNNGDGTWTLADDTIAPGLASGTYDVTVTATDTVGNAGTDSTTGELIVDASNPIVTINTVTTNDGTPQLTGTIDDPTATVTVTVNGQTYTATNNGDGTWTLANDTITPALSSSTYDVAVTATDTLGNTGVDSTTNELIIDTIAPVVTVNSLSTNDGTPQLTGTVDDPTAAIQVTVNGQTYTATNNGNGTWTLADNTIAPALTDGTYDVTATATDTFGNVGTDSTAGELTIDAMAPTVTVNPLTTADRTPQLTGNVDDPTAIVTVTVNGSNYTATNNGDGTWTLANDAITPALADGTYNITVIATDSVGQTGSDNTTNELVVNSAVPLITVNPLTTQDATPQLTGTIDDPTATIQVTVNGTNYTANNNGDGTWTLADDTIVPALMAGTYSITATATNSSGNQGTDSTSNELVINSASSNQAPVTQDVAAAVIPGNTTLIQTFSATDADGSIAAYQISTLPDAQQGILYLNNPAAGGTAVQVGQVLTVAQSQQLFFQAANGFTGTRFTYAAIDNAGGIDRTPATISLSSVANALPVAQDVIFSFDPETPANITGLSATDADGTIVFYTIATLPPTDQGILFLGNPNTGGTAITLGQVLTPAQISQLFFQSASGFAGSQFTYTATDDRGMSDPTPATVTLSLSEFADCECGCEVGSRFTGNNRKDRLQGTPEGDIMIGQNGNDVLRGLECNDLVKGGRGKDRLFGDNGRDTLVGGVGADRLFGGRQDDVLKGRRGNDRLKGEEGNDRLQGGVGRDRLWAGGGNDTLNGGLGKDTLRGGNGDDRLIGRRGNDRLQGGKGNDRLQGRTGRDRLWAGGGNDTLNGGLGKDTLRGGNGDDRLIGRRGNDRLRGGAGQDTLGGGRGNDRLNGFEGNDLLRGASGRDQLWGRRGNDTLIGGLRQDKLQGNQGDDRLIGGRNHDVLLGGSGDNLLWGGRGKDTLEGGAGNDQFIYNRVRDVGDCINQFETNQDVIDLSRIFAQPGYPGSQSFKQSVQLTQDGSDTIVHIDTNGKTTGGFISFITLKNVAVNDLSADQFIL